LLTTKGPAPEVGLSEAKARAASRVRATIKNRRNDSEAGFIMNLS
jgi:hypothetical protein